MDAGGTVTVLYNFSYKNRHEDVSIREGESLSLVEKTNTDWWQVRRSTEDAPFYAPASYLRENTAKSSNSNRPHITESKSDDCLLAQARKKPVNAELLRSRSSSMDAIMFLELLEKEIKDMPANGKPEERSKKPRISKDPYDRRKSWAVEEMTQDLGLRLPRTAHQKRKSLDKEISNSAPKSPPPPRPPRPELRSAGMPSPDKMADKCQKDKSDQAPALPPKKSRAPLNNNNTIASNSPVTEKKRENYSLITPSGKHNWESGEQPASKPTSIKPRIQHLSESLEKLALQIQPPKASPAKQGAYMEQSPTSPPQLPPKRITTGKPLVVKRSIYKSKVANEVAVTGPDNYVNLLRPVTTLEPDQVEPDDLPVGLSFGNPLFTAKENNSVNYTKSLNVSEQLSSSQELESPLDDGHSGLHKKPFRKRHSLSSVATSSEMDLNASSTEDLLSSKDSLNSIPETPHSTGERRGSKSSISNLPSTPPSQHKPKRELFEGWAEYKEPTGRLFYYNRETGAKSWKPPRRFAPSPMNRTSSMEDDLMEESSKESSASGRSPPRKSEMNTQPFKLRRSAIPAGWIEGVDPETDEICYINSDSGARWFTSTDTEGRVYFYEENSNESVWMLPEIHAPQTQEIPQVVFYPEGLKLNPNLSSDIPTHPASREERPTRLKLIKENKAERNSKARSMVLTTSSGTLANILPAEVPPLQPPPSKAYSLPRNIPQWPSLQAGSIVSEYLTNLDTRVIRQGILQRTKLTENGKKLRKNWSSSFVVLTELFLLIFKDSTSKSSSSSGNDKPELCVDLNGANVEWAAEKSSRKNVFQVTTLLGVQLLLQDEESTSALLWFNEIRSAIQALPCGLLGNRESPASFKIGTPTKSVSGDLASPGNPTKSYLSPPSPDDSQHIPKEDFGKKLKINRQKSTKSKVMILGSTEDLTAADSIPGDRQVNLRDKLRKFFVRRPPVDALMKKGIYKDEPVFGCSLHNLCLAEGTKIPRFVQLVIEMIESKADNMKTDGLYRASGNLSQVQKIRLQVDQNNWEVLEQEEDVHVLTGALKLFFRELKEPLIPYPLFERALQASCVSSKLEKIKTFREIVDELPSENYQTLHYLLKHLLRVTEYREFNRMHISNLAIVFGPTLLWPATESANIVIDMMQQNSVVEALLINFSSIFR